MNFESWCCDRHFFFPILLCKILCQYFISARLFSSSEYRLIYRLINRSICTFKHLNEFKIDLWLRNDPRLPVQINFTIVSHRSLHHKIGASLGLAQRDYFSSLKFSNYTCEYVPCGNSNVYWRLERALIRVFWGKILLKSCQFFLNLIGGKNSSRRVICMMEKCVSPGCLRDQAALKGHNFTHSPLEEIHLSLHNLHDCLQ